MKYHKTETLTLHLSLGIVLSIMLSSNADALKEKNRIKELLKNHQRNKIMQNTTNLRLDGLSKSDLNPKAFKLVLPKRPDKLILPARRVKSDLSKSPKTTHQSEYSEVLVPSRSPVKRVDMDINVLRRDIEEDELSEDTESKISSAENGLKDVLENRYRYKSKERAPRFGINSFQPKEAENIKNAASQSYPVRRIVGGMKTQIRMYPYNVAIAKDGKHWCGGSVIDEQWIVTAGHCLEASREFGTGIFRIRAGSSFHYRSGHVAKINKVFFPEGYIPGEADYDMSLARLDRPLPIGKNIAVLNLPAKDFKINKRDVLIVTGWGSTDESGVGNIADRLQFVPVPALTRRSCQNFYDFELTSRMLCAGYTTGGMDACNHDSGGPAVKDGVLLGIVSFGGKKCGDPNSPGVYTRVSELTEWIEETIATNEASTIPELIPRIRSARAREKELKEFKMRVTEKKEQIKIWLKKTLKSPVFIDIAGDKLNTVNVKYRRSHDFIARSDNSNEIDDTNVKHLANEFLNEDESDPVENLINIIALYEIINFKKPISNHNKIDGNTNDYFAK